MAMSWRRFDYVMGVLEICVVTLLEMLWRCYGDVVVVP